jgi:hypothetical protein
MDKTAKYAKANGFEAFSTTILISPYQKHEKVKQIGEEIAKKYGIIFHYIDLRPHYKGSIALSKQMKLYRQKYCGCYLSQREREEKKAR